MHRGRDGNRPDVPQAPCGSRGDDGARVFFFPGVQVADQLVSLVLPGVAALKVGRPEDDADITPVISESSANFIEGLVKDAKDKGAGGAGVGGGWGEGRGEGEGALQGRRRGARR